MGRTHRAMTPRHTWAGTWFSHLNRFAHRRVGENIVRFELHITSAQHLRADKTFKGRARGGRAGEGAPYMVSPNMDECLEFA